MVMENVAQNGRHFLGRGFNPCFVDDARDENPEGVEQNGKKQPLEWKSQRPLNLNFKLLIFN